MTKKFVVIAVALAGCMAMTHSAFARPEAMVAATTPAHAKLSYLDRTYLRLYHRVARRRGDRAPGRNIVRQGLRSGHPPAARHVARSIRVLRRMLTPVAPAIATAAPVAVTTTTVAPTTSYSGGMPACTWQPESGGSYTAVNPSSGAGGKYQIIPSTWKAYGGSGPSAATASPAEQEAVARRVYAGQGASAWVNC